ncbi:MAG TPA: NADH-quinone oxidoreductase subunit N [Candidatus Nitrosocosmicus sp.]|nr:NADH-quinone oxidoreductase subunit N [Candidatus Nitrosocosmicus sp.]
MIDVTSTPILIIILLGVVGLSIPVLDAIKKETGKRKNKLFSGITFGTLIIAILIVISRVLGGEPLPSMSFGPDVLSDDMFGSFFAITLLIVSIMVSASSWNYMRGITNTASYYSLILLSTIGMVLIAYSTDFVMLFIAWELMSIPTYALAAYAKKDPISNEAAIKYFMFGALSSSILVLAIGLVYGVTGTTNIGESIMILAETNSQTQPDQLIGGFIPISYLAIGMFVAGFGFKMGLVPFHMWLPDTYEGAPTTIGALLAAGTKKAGFAAAIRVVVIGMFALGLDWSFVLAILAVITMTVGNLGALLQKSVPRIMAYSSIAQAGYILIGLAIAPYTAMALDGSLFHILNHAVMKSVGFLAIAAIAIGIASYNIDKYVGLGRRMPITAIALTISLLALAGVPPLNGFWSKLVIFESAIDSGTVISWGPYLAIAGLLNSALSLGYYLWIIRKMYLDESKDMSRIKEPKMMLAVLFFGMIFMVGFGIWHAPLLEFASISAPPQFDQILPTLEASLK